MPGDYEVVDGGNTKMKVVVRVRPESEREAGSNTVIRAVDRSVLVFDPKQDNLPHLETGKRRPAIARKPKDLRFAFDRVFDETSTQEEVFEGSTKGKLLELFNHFRLIHSWLNLCSGIPRTTTSISPDTQS